MVDVPLDLADALRDRYTLDRQLGRGGMATVYLAQDRRHERLVALKVLHPELAHALGPERFLREIKLAARLQHPRILPVFDSGESAGLWYSMPYVEGGRGWSELSPKHRRAFLRHGYLRELVLLTGEHPQQRIQRLARGERP